MSRGVTARILHIEKSTEVCDVCDQAKTNLTLRIEADPPDGACVGDVVSAVECASVGCDRSQIKRARLLDG